MVSLLPSVLSQPLFLYYFLHDEYKEIAEVHEIRFSKYARKRAPTSSAKSSARSAELLVEELQRGGLQGLPDEVAGEAAALQEHHLDALPGQQGRRRRPRGASADHEDDNALRHDFFL